MIIPSFCFKPFLLLQIAIIIQIGSADGGLSQEVPHEKSLRSQSPAENQNPSAIVLSTKLGTKSVSEWQVYLKSLDYNSPAVAEEVPLLLELFEHPIIPSQTKMQVGLVLGRIGKPATKSIPLLIDSLNNPEELLWAAKSLSFFRKDAKPAASRLLSIYRDRKRRPIERQVVLEPLSWLGTVDARVLPAMIQQLEDEDNSKDARRLKELTLEAMGVLGPSASTALPILMKFAQSSDESLRTNAVITIGKIGREASQAIPLLIDLILFDHSNEVRDQAVRSMASMGRVAVPYFSKLLNDQADSVQSCAAMGLKQLGKQAVSSKQALLLVRDHSSEGVQIAVLEAIWSVTENSDHLFPTLWNILESEERQIRMRGFRLLVDSSLHQDSVLKRLLQWKQSTHPIRRRVASEALRKFKEHTNR